MANLFNKLIILFLAISGISAFSQSATITDLHKLFQTDGIEIYNWKISLINVAAHKGISLSKDQGEGVAWIKGVEFSEGIIEVTIRGEDVKQHSLVGIAFLGKDNKTFDAIYLRPFQYLETDESLRSLGIQYISLPDYTWRMLRENYPGKYEQAVEPAPDPNSWVNVRIVIMDFTISTYVNGNQKPALVVKKLTVLTNGAIGFYAGDTSGGDFAYLSITKTN